MTVPYTFGTATSQIPLSQLDANFASTITLGNTAIQLGNTVTTLNNMTLANVTVSSGGNVSITSLGVGGASLPASVYQVTLYPTTVSNLSGISVSDSASIANSGFGYFYISSTSVVVEADKAGSGTYKPIVFRTSFTDQVKIDTNGYVGVNTMTPAYPLDVVGVARAQQFRSYATSPVPPMSVASTAKVTNLNADLLDGGDWASPGAIGTTTRNTAAFSNVGIGGNPVAGGLGQITLYPTAVAGASGLFANDGADISNSAYLGFYISGASAYIDSGQSGAGTNMPLLIYTGGGEAARFDTSKNFIQSTNTSAPTLTSNGSMVISRVNNTTLKFSLRGTDGVTRSATITLS